MKLKINSLIKGVAAVFCGAVLFACTDLNELEDRVDSLDSRITALEAQVPSMNKTLEAIDKLLEGQNIFITSFEPVEGKEGEYILTLSDDTSKEYKIVTGVSGSAPQITLEEGVWKVNGEEVGQAAPQFRIDADGNWEVSSDGGKTFDDVKGADGNPVSAVSDGSNEFFKGVSYDEESGIVIFIMADGAEYSFTVSSDFILTITDAEGNALEGIQTFIPGEAKTFNVQLRGVEDIYITKPSGWDVSLTGNEGTGDVTAILTVTPPTREELIGAQTKISADTEKDIVLHATAAASDRAIFAKIQVEAVLTAMPEVTVAAGEFTPTSISFTVDPNTDATSWKYILKPSSEAAPTVDEVNASGTESSDETITIDNNLTTGTEYTIYVLAINTKEETVTTATKLATAKNTPMYDTYYDAYNNNQDIVIAGKTINKTTYGDAVKITESTYKITTATGSNTGKVAVYFIDCETSLNFAESADTPHGTLLLIGNKVNEKVKVTISNRINLNNNTDAENKTFICHNMIFDSQSMTQSPLAFSASVKYGNVILSHCDILWPIETNFIYSNSAEKPIGSIIFDSCKFDFENRTPKQNRPMMACGTGAVTVDEFIFNNNIVYASDVRDVRLLLINSGTVKKISVKNNTFINAWQNIEGGTPVFFSVGTSENLECSHNIIWTDKNATMAGSVLNFTTITGGSCSDNIVYKPNMTQTFYTFRNKAEASAVISGAENFTTIETDPFSGGTFDLRTGTFNPNSTYSSYGSTIGR